MLHMCNTRAAKGNERSGNVVDRAGRREGGGMAMAMPMGMDMDMGMANVSVYALCEFMLCH